MIPPVVGPATRSTSRFSPPASASVRREEAAQLARRRRILEDLELLDVGIAVAAGLEQKVALAKRARFTEEGLGPKGDRVPDGGIERRLDGRHRQKSTRAAAPRTAGSSRRTSVTESNARSAVTISVIPSCRHVARWTTSRAERPGYRPASGASAPHQCVGDGKDRREQILGSFRERRSVGGTSSQQDSDGGSPGRLQQT